MLCKIVGQSEAQAASPMCWPGLAETFAAPPKTWSESGLPAAPAPGNPHDGAGLDTQLADLQAAAERRACEARRQGFDEGRAAERSEASAQLKSAIDGFAEATAEIAGLRPRLRLEAETDLVRLAIAIARRILNRELTVDAETIGALVEAGLQRINAQEVIRVRVHPTQDQPLQAALRARGNERIDVVADPSLERGAAILETSRGNFDASLETQLREIERGLADRLRRRA